MKDLSKTVREKARNLTQDLNPEKESSLSTFRFRPKFKEIIVGAVKPPYCFRGSPLMIGFDDETLKNPNISTPNFFPLSKRNSCHCRTLSEDFPKIILNKTSEIPKERISLKIPTINIHHKLKIEASANLRYDNNQMFLKRFLSKPTVKNNLKSSSLKAIQPPMIEFSDKTEELIIIDDKLEDKSTTFPSDNKNETVIVIPTQVIDIERKEQCIQTSFQDD